MCPEIIGMQDFAAFYLVSRETEGGGGGEGVERLNTFTSCKLANSK